MNHQGIKCVMESIIDEKNVSNTTLFRVRWHGFSPEDDTWENEENIKDKKLLKEYREIKKAKAEKAKKNQNVSPLTKLRQKRPTQVVSIMNFNNKIYYRVLFEDQTFDSVSSDLLKKAAPEIIAKFLVSHFQVHQTINKSKSSNDSTNLVNFV